jgi:galactokinase
MREPAEADAPGRVNLIGDHTDYHDGYVLPTVIPQRTRVRLTPRKDRQVHVSSTAYNGPAEVFELGAETPGRGWLDYVQGVTLVLKRRVHELAGWDVAINSDVPPGAGLSSSAALSVALLRALRAAHRLAFDDIELAVLARAVETDFVGAPVGIMDPMACSLGRPAHALFLDARTLLYEHVRLPPRIAFVVVDSGIAHRHAGGGYGRRRQESLEAARALGVGVLRDAAGTTPEALATLPTPLARRARHVIAENRRVLAAVDAIRQADGSALGQLLNESHESLRDDYEVSTPDIDTLVAIAARHPAVYGARLTGGGFGGAVVVAARHAAADVTAQMIRRDFIEATGLPGEILAIITSPS